MRYLVQELTPAKVDKETKPGTYPDGAGLYLQVAGANAKSWILRYSLRGRVREMGLGSLHKVSLAEACKKAAECHKLLADHVDPKAVRDQHSATNALATNTKTISFKEAADAYCAAHYRELENAKRAMHWRRTLTVYADPILGKLTVRDIDRDLVYQVLEPIWATKPETASRVRGRIECVLGWAKAKGFRDGKNPARWKDNLDQLLAPPKSPERSSVVAALRAADLSEKAAPDS